MSTVARPATTAEPSGAEFFDYELLCDQRYGIVTSIVDRPLSDDVPLAMHAKLAHVTNSALLGQWQGDRIAFGASYDDENLAHYAAIGEAIERYCGNYIPTGLRKTSYQALRAAGEAAIAPAEWILYAPEQYAEEGFPFEPLSEDLAINWVQAQDLLTHEAVWVPASLVYINYYTGQLRDEPHNNFVMYSGIAAGRGRADAERSALEELIERDATMIWWHSGSPAIGIDPKSLPELESWTHSRVPCPHLHYQVIQIPSIFSAPVMGVLLHDQQDHIMTLGVACRPDARAAVKKALIEAVQLRGFAQGLLDPQGSVWQAMNAGILDANVYKPYREDRRYAESYRKDFHDITDLGCQSQFCLDPATHQYAERILKPAQYIGIDQVNTPKLNANTSSEEARQHYLTELKAKGMRALSVDVTTSDVAVSGLSVVRVLVPGLYPNAPAGFPCLGGQRLYTEPQQQGWLEQTLQYQDLVFEPLPHS